MNSSTKKHSTDIMSLLHDQGLFVPTRTIFLRRDDYASDGESESGVDHVFSTKFLKNLHLLESMSSDPIQIVLSTVGGDEIEGMAIYDAIASSPCHITTTVTGQACSMGSIILQAADRRLIRPHSIVMFHKGTSSYSTNHPNIIESWMKFEKGFGDKLDNILYQKIKAKKPRLTKKQFEKMNLFDTVLSAEEAVELGLVDEICER